MLLSASLLVAIITTLIILITARFKDSNRSSYQNRNISYTEIVKKNYINGFENTKNTGKFSYILPNEDINELLSQGLKSIDDKHIENIYFDSDQNGYRFFFVDLKKVGVKTRVAITTIPSIKDDSTVQLSIAAVSIGKVNALSLIQKRGYLSSNFINPYLKDCHLPMTFNEQNLSFEIKPYDWIKSFPSSAMGNYLLNSAKNIKNAYSFNSNVFGFDINISKLSSNRDFVDVDTANVPNIYDEVKTGCLTEFPTMTDEETKTIYSLTEETLNKHIKSSFVSDMEEVITSTLTSKTVKFDLVGANVHLDKLDTITFTLFFSINEYILGTDTDLSFVSSSSISFGAYYIKDESISSFLNTSLTNVLSNLKSNYSYFEYGASEMFHVSLESLNDDPDIGIDIKYAPKSIQIDHSNNTINFLITK